jgi:hypothetical protein
MGPNDMSMGSSKCAYCCSSCCCLYMLITLTISLLVMATSNGSGNPDVTDVVTGNDGTVSNTVTTLLGSAAHRMLAKTEILVLTRLFY